MDGLSAAASVIAVIQISAEVFSLCERYYKGVKKAKSDVERLLSEITSFQHVLESLRTVADGPKASKVFATRTVLESVKQCDTELQNLKLKLQPDKNQKAIEGIRIRALKWPLQSKDVEHIINTLERHKATFSAALGVDQM